MARSLKKTLLVLLLAGTWLPATVVCDVPDRVADILDHVRWVEEDCCDDGFSFDFDFDWW